MLFPVIVGDEVFKYPFGRSVQQSSPGSKNLAWRSEKNVVQQTMLETRDNEVVEVMTRCSGVYLDSDAVIAYAGLVLECGRSRCNQGRAVQVFSIAIRPPIHIGEVWLILPIKQNTRLLTLPERPRVGRCQWTKRPGAVFLPGRRRWLWLALYLDCREGDVGAFWLVILHGQIVGAADSFDTLSSGGGHMSVAAGFVLLDTAVGVVMGRCLMI